MHQNVDFSGQSLELHLFFARIMKEHSLFLKAGLTPVNTDFARETEYYKKEFERVLCCAVSLGDGMISRNVLCSGELFTEFTSKAEAQTECFTGIPINKQITFREERMRYGKRNCFSCEMIQQIHNLNQRALKLVKGLIHLKEKILDKVLCCQMFTTSYPLLLEHIIREAKLYESYICQLETNGALDCQPVGKTESFWNQIMMEHALFIRGLLDPSENELVMKADSFAKDYECLLKECHASFDQQCSGESKDSLEETLKFRDFKASGAEGIENCKIRSVILPLLADHVLREANHYIRLLDNY